MTSVGHVTPVSLLDPLHFQGLFPLTEDGTETFVAKRPVSVSYSPTCLRSHLNLRFLQPHSSADLISPDGWLDLTLTARVASHHFGKSLLSVLPDRAPDRHDTQVSSVQTETLKTLPAQVGYKVGFSRIYCLPHTSWNKLFFCFVSSLSGDSSDTVDAPRLKQETNESETLNPVESFSH